MPTCGAASRLSEKWDRLPACRSAEITGWKPMPQVFIGPLQRRAESGEREKGDEYRERRGRKGESRPVARSETGQNEAKSGEVRARRKAMSAESQGGEEQAR